EDAGVARALLAVEPAVTEDAEPVVHRDQDHVTASAQVHAVVEQARARARLEATAVEPDQHRPAGVVAARRPHVEAETVLADRRAVAAETTDGEPAVGLRRGRPVQPGLADSGP